MLGFEKLKRGSEVERSKNEVRKGRGIYSRSVKPLVRRNWTNVPLTLLIRLTCVTHVLRGGDRVRSWVNRKMHHGMRNCLSGKTENLDKISFKVPFTISSADRTQ